MKSRSAWAWANPAKRIGDPFEELLRALVERGAFILIDKGAGGEEAARVEAAIGGLPPERVQCWEGRLCSLCCGNRPQRYVHWIRFRGAARGGSMRRQLVSIFAGFPSRRVMFALATDGSGGGSRLCEWRIQSRDACSRGRCAQSIIEVVGWIWHNSRHDLLSSKSEPKSEGIATERKKPKDLRSLPSAAPVARVRRPACRTVQ